MKSIITAALVLGLAVISCKKETTTDTTTNMDSVSSDTMNMNPAPVPTDSMTTTPMSGDSSGMMNRDSARTTPTAPVR